MSRQAVDTIRRLLRLFEEHRARIHRIGRGAASALRLYDLLTERVYVSLPMAEKTLKLSFPTVTKSVGHLERLGIVREATGRRRNRVFHYEPYLKILLEGTQEPAG